MGRWIARTLVASLAAAGLAYVLRRSRSAPERGPVAARTRGARTAEVVRLGSRVSARLAVHRARRVFASAERRESLDREVELRTASDVVERLGQMKGALMKLGQLASFIDDGMPEEVRTTLAQLQQDAPPMSPELAAEVVSSELGAAPDEVFAEWDPDPIAAASIGQVHRAITREGRAVAVKVQYPGVDDAIRADLENAGLLFQASRMIAPGLEPGPIVEELRARLLEELDYTVEASNQQLFADYYRGHPTIHVPDVVPELCSRRVLTTELATGARFEELCSWPQDERDRAAETMFRFVFGSLYRMHAFNGDPHPGNYLFRPGGHVTFLDFGLVKRFADDEIALIADMARTCVVEHDVPAFRRAIERAGFLHDGAPVSDEQMMDYFGHFYSFVRHDEAFTITREYATDLARRFMLGAITFGDVVRHANLPPAFLILQRINLGLYAILGRLEPTANWRAIGEEVWPFTQRDPTTELGRLEAAWRRSRVSTSAP